MGSSFGATQTVTLSETASGMPGAYKKLTGSSDASAPSTPTESIASSAITKDLSNKFLTAGVVIGIPFYGGTAATATLVGSAALDDSDGDNFILINADGSTVTFHTDPTKNFGDTSNDDGDHRWIINTRDIADSGGDEVRKATQAVHIAILTAIAAGELDMTVVPTTNTGTQTSIALTQNTSEVAGNTAITLIDGVTKVGDPAFTGGVAAASGKLTLQASYDGTNWFEIGVTIVADSTPEVVGIKMGTVDLRDIYVPQIRLCFNEEEAVVDDSGSAGILNFIMSTPS